MPGQAAAHEQADHRHAEPAPTSAPDLGPDHAPTVGALVPVPGLVHRRTAGCAESSQPPVISALRRRATEPLLIRRTPEWKENKHPDDYLDKFVKALDTLVQDAATRSLEPATLPDGDGYLRLWKDTALILQAISEDKVDDDDPDAVAEARAAKSFGAARYGYAIESLACSSTGTLNAALPSGCSFQLQATRGMTRPDLVVFHGDDEVAWLDITSSGSIGHIDLKVGTGWKARTYVAEITYPPLDITKLGKSALGIGERVAFKNAFKRRQQSWEATLAYTRRKFKERFEDASSYEASKAERQRGARAAAAGLLGIDEITPDDTKSLIRAWSLSVKDYGWDSGGTKARGEEILRTEYGA